MKRQPDLAEKIFGTQAFFRTLSSREFATSLSLAVLFVALYRTIAYYSIEDWIQHKETILKLSVFSGVLLISHIIYRLEHRRQNNFAGRCLHDGIFLFFTFGLLKIERYATGAQFEISANDVSSAATSIVALIILIVVFESAVALVRRIMAFFGWRAL